MTLSRRQFVLCSALAATSLATFKMRAYARAADRVGLKDVYKDDFRVGTILGRRMLQDFPADMQELVAKEFDALTLGNDMKWSRIHPSPELWDFDIADAFIEFARKHGIYTVGHVLVWHSQVPDWVFKHPDGKPLTREQLLKRMENHIEILAGRYKGKINVWDVVNEGIDEGKGWRKSHWYNIIGDDYMDKAFGFAHDTDPNAQLLYNDYNMHNPKKRAFLVDYLKQAKKRGVPINGVGMQGHVGLGFPDIDEFEASLVAYAKQGMRVHITEFDVDVLPVAWKFTGAEISTSFKYSEELNPYVKGLPKEIEDQLTERYTAFFKLFLKHRDKIDRVTMWGIGDGDSWKNNFPVKGRTNYPLLFDRKYRKKACYHAVMGLKT